MDKPTHEKQSDSGVTFRLSSTHLIVLGLLALGTVWGGYLLSKPKSQPAPIAQPGATPLAVPTPLLNGNANAPWGHLEAIYFNIERPDSFLTIADPFTEKTRWVFEKQSRAEIEVLFEKAGLSESQKSALLNPAHCKETAGGLEIWPDHRLLLEINTTARETIYPVLSRSALNPRHHSPFSFLERWMADRFHTNSVSPETIGIIRNLLYRQGEAICFADLPALFDVVTDPQERKNVVKSLSRSAALIVNLRVTLETELGSIINYWSRGWHAKDRAAFIRSLARSSSPSGNAVDIIHLLPPLARERLNTYPYPQLGSNDDKFNCYWTALNFANAIPDPALSHEHAALDKLKSDYYPITDKPAFGDLICLVNPKGEPFHMANYIADEIVFTKNGYHHHNPWILTTLTDMISHYPAHQPCSALIYRKKDQPPVASN